MRRETKITAFASFFFLTFFFLHQVMTKPTGQRSEKMKIGFIYDGDESIPNTNNFIRSQHLLEEQYNDEISIIVRNNVSPDQIEAAIDEMAREKCSIIFTTSYAHSIVAKECAEKYPEIQICQATGDNAQEEPFISNYHTFMGEIYQGRYISGIVAGMKLKELIENGVITAEQAKLGYVGSYPFPEVISGYTAFLLGARSIVPSTTMTVIYSYTWSSFSQEKACAEHLINNGCIIISQHSDTVGPAVACEAAFEKNIFHIGYNQNMIDIAPMTSLMSTRINWTPYITGAVEAVLNKKSIEKTVKGHVHGNDVGAGIDLNWVQILELNSIITAKGTEEQIAKAIQNFKRGKINVYVGDYIGVNPYDENDIYDLRKGFKENANSSAPSFNYVLKDVIKVDEISLFQN